MTAPILPEKYKEKSGSGFLHSAVYVLVVRLLTTPTLPRDLPLQIDAHI